MIIFKDHARIIKFIDAPKKAIEIMQLFPENERHKVSRRLIELKIMGIIEEMGEEVIRLTKFGKMIADAINWIESHYKPIDKLDLPNEIFINSQIIKMLEIVDRTNYIPEGWKSFLTERYLLTDSQLNEAAKLILEAYNKLTAIIYLTSDIAEFIAGIPPGPADYKVLVEYRETFGYGQNAIYALEALRFIQLSPPWKGKVVYTLTRAGRLIRELLGEIPLYKPLMLVNDRIRILLSKGVKELSPSEKRDLSEHGFFDESKDEFTNLGKRISEVYELVRNPSIEILPFYISVNEIKLLKFIQETLEKNKSNPEIFPTVSYIKEKSHIEDVGFYLHILESKNLIEKENWKNKTAYVLTLYGQEVVKYFGDLNRTLPTDAVKAITFAYKGDVPRADWVEKAEEFKLLSNGSLTYKGKKILELCTKIKRNVITTAYDVAIILKVPETKSITREKLIDEIIPILSEKVSSEKEAIDIAISEAESKGLIIVYQNDAVILTDVGKAIKRAIQMAKTNVIKGMKISLTPTLLNVLEVIKNNENEFAKAWREKEELTSVLMNILKKKLKMSEEDIKENVTLLRGMGFIGRKRGGRILTEAGELLLESKNMLVAYSK